MYNSESTTKSKNNDFFIQRIREKLAVKLSNSENYVLFMMFGTIIILYFTLHLCASFDAREELVTSTCTTAECLKAAESIISNMNTSHKPCDNFYLFACGKYVKGANVPKGQGFVDSVSTMKYELQKKLKVGLEQRILNNELRAFELLQSYYKTCLNFGNKSWKDCVDYVIENLPLASGGFYIKNYFNQTLKVDMLEITKNIKKSYNSILSEASWMDNRTKTVAQKKLESINIHAAYPDELLNDKKLDDYYKSLPNPTNNFLENHLALMKFNNENKLKHSNKNDWTVHDSSAMIDVIYRDEDNSIDILAGSLQEPFMAVGKPKYVNYGGIGPVIAREISHGFDQKGSQFDENGNKKNWWDAKTMSQYESRSRCFVEQYSKYKASKRKIPLNAEYTLRENIADNTGFKIAYHAYEEWEKQNGQEPGLPGLPYTSRQLFWISAANTACTRFRRKGWDIFLKDKYSPAPFRIIGSFSNLQEFASDFKCPIGSRMNPKNKCSLT